MERLYISPEYTIFFDDVTKQQIDSGWDGGIRPNLEQTSRRIEKSMRGILSASGRPVLSLPCKKYPYDEDYFYINFVVDENATICYVSADVVDHLCGIRSSNFYYMILNGIELDCHCNRVLGPGSDHINILGSNFVRAVDASIMCDWSNCKMELVPSTARELPRPIPLAQGVNGDCDTRFAEITEEDVRSGWGGRIDANLSPGTLKSADAGALTKAPFQRPIISLCCHTPGKGSFNVAFVIDRHRDTLLSPEVISSLFRNPLMASSTEPLSVFINSVQVDCGVSPALERHINFLGRDYLKKLGLSMQIDWEQETFRMVEAAEIR